MRPPKNFEHQPPLVLSRVLLRSPSLIYREQWEGLRFPSDVYKLAEGGNVTIKQPLAKKVFSFRIKKTHIVLSS